MSNLVAAGVRTGQRKGGSIAVTLPKREVREHLDIDPDELDGEVFMTRLYDDGKYEVELLKQR